MADFAEYLEKKYLPDIKDMTEQTFRFAVQDGARATGWECVYFPDSRWSKTSGFPDLILWHEANRIPPWYLELKSAKGRLRPGQINMIRGITNAGGIARVAWPIDWAKVVEVLEFEFPPVEFPMYWNRQQAR